MFLTRRQFADQLFGIGAVLDVEAGEDLDRLFAFDDTIHAHQMLPRQPARRLCRQVDDKRQKRPIELEHIHPQAKGRQVLLPRVAQLAQGQFRDGTVVKHLDLVAEAGLAGHRGHPHHRQGAAPEFGAPGPVGPMRAGKGGGADTRQRQAPVGDVDQLVELGAQLPGGVALLAQERQWRAGGLSHRTAPAPQCACIQQLLQKSAHPAPTARVLACLPGMFARICPPY
jgi:hypothetical protein